MGTGAFITAVVTFIIFVINIALTFYLMFYLFKQTTINNNVISILYSKHPYNIGLIVILLLPFLEEILFKAQIFKNTKFLDNHKVIKTIIIAYSLHVFIV